MLLSARLYNGVPVRSAHLRRDEILFTVGSRCWTPCGTAIMSG